MLHCFAFDIETIPDTALGSRLYDLDGLSDEDIAQVMFNRQMEKTGREFLPLHQHRVAAISIAMRSRDGFRVWSLGEESSDEKEIVSRFFDGIDRFTPDLVSWNGSGFDLPVLNYRAMKHGITASRYWESGDDDQSFRWNNYQSRFHWRHVDLMDVLASFQNRARAPLDEIAVMLGFPGKLGMSGAKVWDAWCAGDISGIRNYCETDALNTYLIFLRFELMRGRVNNKEYADELQLVRETLRQSIDDTQGDNKRKTEKNHFKEFLEAWPE